MNLNYKKNAPFGVTFLCVFYVINALLFFVTTLIFFGYLDIIIFGNTIDGMPASLIRLILIIFPLYLALGLPFLRKDIYFLTISYHLFFLINGVLMVLYFHEKTNSRLRPLLEIALKPEYKVWRISDLFVTPFHVYFVQIVGAIIGVFIIIYLLARKKLFTA